MPLQCRVTQPAEDNFAVGYHPVPASADDPAACGRVRCVKQRLQYVWIRHPGQRNAFIEQDRFDGLEVRMLYTLPVRRQELLGKRAQRLEQRIPLLVLLGEERSQRTEDSFPADTHEIPAHLLQGGV